MKGPGEMPRQSFPYKPHMRVMTPDGPGTIQKTWEPKHHNRRVTCAQSAIEYAIAQGAQLDPKTEYYSMSAEIKLENGEINTYHALGLVQAPRIKPKAQKPPRIKRTTVVVTAPASDAPVQGHRVPVDDEVLHCQEGHTWTRPGGQRGRKPQYCPKHQPEHEHGPEMQTLICKEGNHEWTRPSQRGKKPEYCPVHKPQPAKPAERRTVAPRATSNGEVVSRISADALAVLKAPNVDPELRYKLEYIVGVLSNPTNRERADIDALAKRQRELVGEHNRRVTRV